MSGASARHGSGAGLGGGGGGKWDLLGAEKLIKTSDQWKLRHPGVIPPSQWEG